MLLLLLVLLTLLLVLLQCVLQPRRAQAGAARDGGPSSPMQGRALVAAYVQPAGLAQGLHAERCFRGEGL